MWYHEQRAVYAPVLPLFSSSSKKVEDDQPIPFSLFQSLSPGQTWKVPSFPLLGSKCTMFSLPSFGPSGLVEHEIVLLFLYAAFFLPSHDQ